MPNTFRPDPDTLRWAADRIEREASCDQETIELGGDDNQAEQDFRDRLVTELVANGPYIMATVIRQWASEAERDKPAAEPVRCVDVHQAMKDLHEMKSALAKVATYFNIAPLEEEVS